VLVYDEGTPAPDRWVVFHDPSGAVTALTKTGKDGRASGVVERGGMVTVVDDSSMHKLVTVCDVEPDEEIVVGEKEEEEGKATTVCTAMVSLAAPRPNATQYVVSLGVGATEAPSGGAPLPLPVLRRFLVDGRFPVLAEALGPSGEPVA
jgi:hypothetical protein